MDSQRVLKKAVTDFIILAAVALPILIFRYFVNPVKRGFFCNDETIRYPYKDSTVPNIALYVVGLGLPIITMGVTEGLLARNSKQPYVPIYVCGIRIPLWVVNWYEMAGVFCFGAACSQLITDVGKYTIGRLRPHFIDVCDPDINCNSTKYTYTYNTEYTCLGASSKKLREARLSFPSGHSSFSAYSMLYLAIYIQARIHWKNSHLLKHAAQLCCILISWATALSRVNDNKHHWSDVTVGLIIGCVTAIVTFLITRKGLSEGFNLGYVKEELGRLLDSQHLDSSYVEPSTLRSRGNRGRFKSTVMLA